MKLSRDTIQRMVEGRTGSSGSGSGVIGVTEQRVMEILQDYETIEALETTLQSYVTNNALTQTLQSYVTNTALNTTLQDYVTNTSLVTTLASYATKEWVDDNYLSLSFFNALFEARTSEGEAVAPNDGDTSTIESIKAMFGFWTDQYVSALGQSPDGGSGSGSSRITPVDMDLLTPSSTFAAGDAIAFNGVIYRATGATDNFPIPLVVSGNNFVVNEYKGYKAYVRGSEVIQDGWQVWLDTGLNYWIEKHEDRISQAERDIQILYSMGGGGSGGGSVDPDVMWELLAAGSSEQINTTHLTSALSPYASKDYISAQGFATQAWVSANFNNYSLPLASSSTRGGVKTGFTTDAANRNYAIQLSSEKMYVNVPWTDTNTWRPVQDNLTSTSTTDSLSANQGYLLANGSARDDSKLPLTGGTITGALTVNGLLTAAGGFLLSSFLKVGEIYIGYDETNDALEIYKVDTESGTHTAANVYSLGGISALGIAPGGGGGGGGGGTSLFPVDESSIAPNRAYSLNDIFALNGVIYRCTGTTANTPLTMVVDGNNFVVNEYKGYKAYVVSGSAVQSGWELWLDTGVNYWIEKHEDRISENRRSIIELQNAASSYATTQWVKDQRYTTESFIRSQGFLTSANLSDYVTNSSLATTLQSYVTNSALTTTLSSYATQAWVSANFNNYSLPLASSSTRGGVKTGFTTDAANRNYAIQLSSEKMYVNVPWTDTNTWRPVQDNLTSTSTTDSLSAKQGYLLANGSARDNTKLPLSGGTMTGKLNLLANQYDYVTNSNSYGLGCNNSDIVGVNGIFTNDLSESWSEGLNFARSNGNWDTIRAADGTFYLEYNSGTQMAYFNINGLYLKNGWLRTYGSTGWYNESHGGGWYMEDDTWIRSYNSKYVWINTYLCAQHISAGTSSTNSNYALYVSGTGYFSTGVYSAGYVTALSDKRHKDIESEIDLTAKDIAAMPAVKFRWNDRNDAALHAGTIAQEWQNILPEVVSEGEDPDKTLSMDYGVAALVATIITARQVMDHERRICELEKENAALKKELEYIKHQ